MLYSPSRKLAFLHIHKTGGESLRKVLQSAVPDLEHLEELPGAHHFLPELFGVLAARGEDPLDTTVVATICHPKAHAVSIYEYWRSDRIPSEEQVLAHVALTRRSSFAEFLTHVLVRDQFEEYLSVDGVVPPNVAILRRESLAGDATELLERILGHEVSVDMPVINRTRHAPAETYFDDGTTELLRRSYAWTFSQGWYDPEVVPPDAASDERPGPLGRLRRALTSHRG